MDKQKKQKKNKRNMNLLLFASTICNRYNKINTILAVF